MSSLVNLVPVPSDESINGGKTSCPTSFLIRKYGMPIKPEGLSQKCQMPTSKFWKSRMVTADIGPFRVTGHKLAVAQLTKAMSALAARHPEVYNTLGTAGMLCVRYVRGSKTLLSNHSLGLAIDFTLEGHLDKRGDNMVQEGLLLLYAVMKEFGFYWGAEFRTEDAMHFELCAEFVMDAVRNGTF